MTDPDELTEILQVVEHRLRPTPDERDRVRAVMRHELREYRNQGASPLALLDALAEGEVEDLGVLIPDDSASAAGIWRQQRALMLAAASIVVVMLIAVALLVREDRSELATDLGTSTTSEAPGPSTTAPPASGPATSLARDQLGTVLAADRYSAVLDGTVVAFDVTDGQRLDVFEDDRLRLVDTESGVGPAPKELTIAILRQPFGGGTAADWLEANDVTYFDNFVMANGERAVDHELELSAPACDSLAPCLDIAHQRAAEATDAPLTLIDGPNRLLVLELSPDRSLVVLDTSGGNRSGPAQVRYNAIVASLDILGT